MSFSTLTKEISEIMSPEVEHEMREITREYFRDLWENTMADGLDPMIVIETVMEAALNEVSDLEGEDKPRLLLSSLIAKDEHGHFLSARTLQ